jgi:hypothetical protein
VPPVHDGLDGADAGSAEDSGLDEPMQRRGASAGGSGGESDPESALRRRAADDGHDDSGAEQMDGLGPEASADEDNDGGANEDANAANLLLSASNSHHSSDPNTAHPPLLTAGRQTPPLTSGRAQSSGGVGKGGQWTAEQRAILKKYVAHGGVVSYHQSQTEVARRLQNLQTLRSVAFVLYLCACVCVFVYVPCK